MNTYLLEKYTLERKDEYVGDNEKCGYAYAFYRVDTSKVNPINLDTAHSGPFKILAEIEKSDNYNCVDTEDAKKYLPYQLNNETYINACMICDNDFLIEFNSDDEAKLWFELTYKMSV